MDKIATKEALERVSQVLNDKIETISGSVPNIIGDISDLSSPPVEISISRCDELSNCLYLKTRDNELLPRIDSVLNLMEVGESQTVAAYMIDDQLQFEHGGCTAAFGYYILNNQNKISKGKIYVLGKDPDADMAAVGALYINIS